MKKKKLMIGLLIAAVVFIAAAGVYAYVFFYDAFDIVAEHIGYSAKLPGDMEEDDSLSRVYTVAENAYLKAVISVERSPYLSKWEYIDDSFDRFVENGDWQAANGAKIVRNEDVGGCRVLTVRLDTVPEGMADTYVYVTRNVPLTRYFLRAMLKYRSADAERAEGDVEQFIESFRPMLTFEEKRLETDFVPVTPDDWTEETRAAYGKLLSADSPYFGAFSRDVAALEGELGRALPLALAYCGINEELPIDRMENWYARGKLTELTLQLTENGNMELFNAASPLLGVLSGKYDAILRDMAQKLRDFGHPVLFRLNNEMNSDWTSWSGVVNLSDPELYGAAWRYVYDLFDREGAHNLIWVWNPNDRDFPPAGWNSFLAYWPGNGYVHMLGVTGYNTGTYYKETTQEDWRTFREIYDAIREEYLPHFADFPWMITEFASSSVGGDKAQWIRDMFRDLPRYPEIKAAVWFDYADFDLSVSAETVSRPYWLAETPETAEAFARGIEGAAERFFE